jgi:glycine cleavage system H protein
MPSPSDRVYSTSHEWHKIEGDRITLGLTRFAVDQLTDITYVQVRTPGTRVERGGVVGEVESVKTTSDIYTAAGGEIIEVNPALAGDPGLLNRDPYGEGWVARLKVRDPGELGSCMSAAEYDAAHAT